MGKNYYRTTEAITYKLGDVATTFVVSDERVELIPNEQLNDVGMYLNKDSEKCWIHGSAIRPETTKEAAEELLIGEW